MWHEKNFLKGPLNYLAVLPQTFSQIEKGIVGQKMLFFSRFDLVNCINPTFFAETCCTFMQLSWQKRPTYNTSSTSQPDMKGEAPRRKGLCFYFSYKEFPAHQRWMAKERKTKIPRGIFSTSELHRTSQQDQAGQNWTVLSRLWGKSPKAWTPASRGRGRDKPHVRERKKHIVPFTMDFP